MTTTTTGERPAPLAGLRPLAPGPVPLWYAVKEQLREAILSGAYQPGDRLATEQELINALGVSRITVRSALGHLVQERLIERHAGRGTFVRGPVVEQPVTRLAGFHEDMEARGFRASAQTRILEFRPAPTLAVREFLGAGDEPQLFISRLLLADGGPVALQESWVARWAVRDEKRFTADALDHGSLYDLLERFADARPSRAQEVIEAAGAPRHVADALGIRPGRPILVAHRWSKDARGRHVEYVRVSYRADRYRYTIELTR